MELSNSQANLLSTKIRDISKNDITTKEIMDFIRDKCKERAFDYKKVCGELITAIDRTPNIRNVSAFVRAVVGKLDPKAFKENKLTPNFDSLTRALNKANINGETWELFLIQMIEEHALNEFKISVNDLVTTNRAIIEYCKSKGIHTLEEFKELLLRSRVIKECNIPIVVLEKQAREMGERHDHVMKELEEDESLYGTPEED